MSQSVWRMRSVAIISAALDGLPKGTSDKEARKACSPLYPFGQRKYLPYNMWLAVLRELIASRVRAGHLTSEKQKPVPVVALVFLGEHLHLAVRCDWCRSRAAGCLMCGQTHEQLARLVADPEFRRLRAAAALDDAVRPILGDWMEENTGQRAGL